MNKSNRSKRKLLNLTYRSLNCEFKNKVTIKRDPLCRLYEVNRYCVTVTHSTRTPKEIVRFLESVIKKRYPDCVTKEDAFGYNLNVDGLVYHMYITKGMDNKQLVSVGIF